MKKINLVISGLHFGITAALCYFEWAAKRDDKFNLITIGSYHGVNMPYEKVSVIPEKYILKPDIEFPPMPIGDSSVPIEMVEARLPEDFIPDIWLTVDAGFRLQGKPSKGINTVFLTDPHTGLRGIYDRFESQYDLIFNPQTMYSKPNERYLPYAADAVYHRPLENIEKIYDVCIIGNYYPQRVELIDKLRAKGIKCFFELGLAKEDAQLVMNQSRICVNWSSMDDLTARVFETMGTGICLVANRVPDLVNMFTDGTDFVGFSDIGEAITKIDNLLLDEKELIRIADNGRKRIEDGKHFWGDRLDTILKVAGIDVQ